MGLTLEESLVEFFKQTTVSAAVIKTFAKVNEPLTFDALSEGVAAFVGSRIPDYALEGVLRTSLRLLKSSGWVAKSEDGFILTELGRELAGKL
jgi:hypothetical protein